MLNRNGIYDILEKKVKEDTEDKKICIALGDIDNFRKIVDLYGNQCGDALIKEVAIEMNNFMQDKGIVGRWSGEEYLLIFENMLGEDAYYYLNCLKKQIKITNFTYLDEKFSLTMTFGVVEYSSDNTIDSNIIEAEKKVCLGKQSGRNTIIF